MGIPFRRPHFRVNSTRKIREAATLGTRGFWAWGGVVWWWGIRCYFALSGIFFGESVTGCERRRGRQIPTWPIWARKRMAPNAGEYPSHCRAGVAIKFQSVPRAR